MKFVLGYLPDGTKEHDIRELFRQFAPVSEVVFFENGTVKHSEYECLVTMDISDPIVGFIIANRLQHYCWKGCTINSHLLIF